MAKSTGFTAAQLYLIAYNSLCSVGWAYVLALAVPSFVRCALSSRDDGLLDALRSAAEQLYSATPETAGFGSHGDVSLARVLIVVQCAAMLEIVHAALGIVRSPLLVTSLQVGSRIVALHMIVNSVVAQSKFHLDLYIYIHICVYMHTFVCLHLIPCCCHYHSHHHLLLRL